MTTGWNPSDKDANITLSGTGNVVAAQSSASNSWKSVRAVTGALLGSTAKVYWEVQITAKDANAGWLAGLGDASANLASYAGSDAHAIGYQPSGSTVYINGGYSGNHGLNPGNVGDWWGFALDCNTNKLWVVNVTNDPTHCAGSSSSTQPFSDIAAGTNGGSLGSISGTVYPMFSGDDNTTTDSATIDTTGSHGTIPTGFTALSGGSSPQTLTPSLFTNSQTFYAPTVRNDVIQPALFTNAQTFFSPTVKATYSVTPSLFTNSQFFYYPTVGGGRYGLGPGANGFLTGSLEFTSSAGGGAFATGGGAQVLSATNNAKRYFEVYPQNLTNNASGVGLAVPDFVLADLGNAGLYTLGNDLGHIWDGASTPGGDNFGGWVDNRWGAIAIDVAANKIWYNDNAAVPRWNFSTSGTQDPGTGAGGIPLDASLLGKALAPFIYSASSGESFTFNLGESTGAGTLPTGFSWWELVDSRTLTPALFTNVETFFSPSIGGADHLFPPLFTETQTFFAPTVSPGSSTLHPALFTESQFFYTSIVTVLSLKAPNLIIIG